MTGGLPAHAGGAQVDAKSSEKRSDGPPVAGRNKPDSRWNNRSQCLSALGPIRASGDLACLRSAWTSYRLRTARADVGTEPKLLPSVRIPAGCCARPRPFRAGDLRM